MNDIFHGLKDRIVAVVGQTVSVYGGASVI